MMEQEYKYMVCTVCATYNHAPYIVDTMNGFTMQETTFPVYYLITDDASTDGEPEVIKQYLSEHFQEPYRTEETDDYHLICANHKTNPNCIFIVFLLKYNHYSIKKSKLPYQSEWRENAKYIAVCEGDDYWIDSLKLQKQITFLEAHTDYTMVCNRVKLYSERTKKYVGEDYCYKRDRKVNVKDVINRTGLFIPTCSIAYNKRVTDNYPEYCKNSTVGDYPLQIMCAMKGSIFYFNSAMSVYRIDNTTSWVGKQKEMVRVSDEKLRDVSSRIRLFRGFSKDFPDHKIVLRNKIAQYINSEIPNWTHSVNETNEYIQYFSEEIKKYSLRWKLDLWIRTLKIPKVYGWYRRLLLRSYSQKRLFYQ